MRGQQTVEVVAAEEGITAYREDFVIIQPAADDRDIEGAAAQVVNEISSVAVISEPRIVDGGGGRFVQQLDDLEAGQFTGLPRRLDLIVIEIGRHRDDGRIEELPRIIQSAGQHVPEHAENARGDFRRRELLWTQRELAR
jgi:hypothetical protein